MKRFTGLAFVTLLSVTSSAVAAPFFVRGEFNGWGTTHEMVETSPGSGHFTLAVTGLTTATEYKIADADWNQSWPGSNGKVVPDASGTITFHFYQGAASDGWLPAADRAGYEGTSHGWDIMGSFDGWATGVDMAHLGGNVYQASLVVPTPGTYDYKYRKDDDWGVSIGDNFGNSAANLQFTTTAAGESVTFTLDLPGGRHVATVPEPAAACVLTLGGLVAMRRRR